MNEVKVWCEMCEGRGDSACNGGCCGKGYTVHSFGELAHDAHFSINERDRYDITDAQSDAAVLDVINRELEFEYGINGYKPDQRLNKISDSILDRLHAFYCGGTP